MMSQYSHCARNYSLRGSMASHPCGTHSTAIRGAVAMQGLQADPAPPGDTFFGSSMMMPEDSSLHLSWWMAVSTPTSGMWHSRLPTKCKAIACSEIQMLAEGTMGKCVPHPVSLVHTSCLTCSLPSCSVTQHCSKKGFLSWSHSS